MIVRNLDNFEFQIFSWPSVIDEHPQMIKEV